QGSLRLAEALIFAAERARRPGHRAMGLMARGDAVRALGRFAEAVACLDEAGAAFLALGDEVGWARTRLGWLVATYYTGQGSAATRCWSPGRTRTSPMSTPGRGTTPARCSGTRSPSPSRSARASPSRPPGAR